MIVMIMMAVMIIIIIIIAIIYHLMLDLLEIEFSCLFMYDISNLISRVIGLKSLYNLTSSFMFSPIFF